MGKGRKKKVQQNTAPQNQSKGNGASANQTSPQGTKSPTQSIDAGIKALDLSEEPKQVQTKPQEEVASPAKIVEQPSPVKSAPQIVESSPVKAPTPRKEQPSPVKMTTMTSAVGFTKRMLEPPRAGARSEKVGTAGRMIKVDVNFLPMKINVPGGTVYHYDVDFKFPWKREVRKSDRPLLIRVVEAFKKEHQEILGNPYSIVFDGLKNIYTCRQLKFPGGDFEGKAEVPKDQDSAEKIEMIVKMKLVGSVPINHAIQEYISRGTSATRPADAMQVLNIILGMTPQLHYVSVGRNYFNHDHKDCVVDLGGAKSLWVGTFKSVRMGWMPMLNVDMANKPAYEKMAVIDFVHKIINNASRGRYQQGRQQQPPLSDKREYSMVENEMKGLKVRYNRPDGEKRDYRVNKFMSSANNLKMKLDTGEVITIQKYFQDTYKAELKHPYLPCLHIGDPAKTIYIPMEFCEIKQQLAPLSKKLSDKEGANMIKETAVVPKERKIRIDENMRAMNHYYQKDPYAKEFGIRCEDKWLTIDARVLKPPVLKYQYGENGKDKEVAFEKVSGGKWNMGAMRDKEKFKFVKGASLNIWGLLDLARISDSDMEVFVTALYNEGVSRGLGIEYPEYGRADHRNLNDVEKQFMNLRQVILEKHKVEPQLIMVICPEKGPFRASIKYIGDAVLNIPTQFIMKINALGRDRGPNPQTLHNICLKLNSKIGGINQALHNSVRPDIMKVPVMIMGADVTHPSPSDMSRKPSIAAVVGSCDPNASKYNTEVRLQNSAQVVEIIEKMEEMTKSLLIKFQKHSNHWPKKIVFYRDGVSEGQFIEVLNSELMSIRKACGAIGKQIGHSYEPQITFVVAQKRHKTFPKPVREQDGVGDTKNVPPGTVIDTVICHPTEKDFYLASQLAIKGTVKPAHYHVLWDDNRMSPDELQRLTYDLCHLYSRCERSVSYPAPTYYSHLAAFRAREHHNSLIDKTPHRKSEEVRPEDIKKMENLDMNNYFI